MNKFKTLNKKSKYKEELDFLKKAKQFFGLSSKEVEKPTQSEAPSLSKEDVKEIRKKVSSAIGLACGTLKLYDIPLIYYNFYGLERYNHLYYTDHPYYSDRGNPQKGSTFFLGEVKYSIDRDYSGTDYLNRTMGERVSGILSFIMEDITDLINSNVIDLKTDNPDTEELFSLIKQHGKNADKLNDLLYYNKQIITKQYPKSNHPELKTIEKLSQHLEKREEPKLDESYLYNLFEDENEVPPVEEPSVRPKTADKLSDEDIDILNDELTTPASTPSQEPEGVSSASMGIEDVLKNIAQWKNDFEKSPVLDSFIAGADIVENETERTSFQYLTDSQYSDFSKLIDSARDIATLINDLSYDSEKLLGEIELSRKMMVSTREE